jgi:hypothetical protein
MSDKECRAVLKGIEPQALRPIEDADDDGAGPAPVPLAAVEDGGDDGDGITGGGGVEVAPPASKKAKLAFAKQDGFLPLPEGHVHVVLKPPLPPPAEAPPSPSAMGPVDPEPEEVVEAVVGDDGIIGGGAGPAAALGAKKAHVSVILMGPNVFLVFCFC